jgi:hypothetical protein
LIEPAAGLGNTTRMTSIRRMVFAVGGPLAAAAIGSLSLRRAPQIYA